MVTCPVCEGTIDVDEEDVDEGDTISCDECGADLKVVGTDPLELESAEELEEEEEDKADFLEGRRRGIGRGLEIGDAHEDRSGAGVGRRCDAGRGACLRTGKEERR